MIITLSGGISFEEFSKRYDTTSEKIMDWDKIMASFQVPPPGAKEGQTWIPMEMIYDFKM